MSSQMNHDDDIEICNAATDELRAAFTQNAEEFDSLMVRMLEMNTQLIERVDELEKALRYVIEDLELRASIAGTDVVELGSGAYEQAKGALK